MENPEGKKTHNKHEHTQKDNAAKTNIKERGWENTKWLYRFQHTGLIVFCEHTNEHCGSVKGGRGMEGLPCRWATIITKQEVRRVMSSGIWQCRSVSSYCRFGRSYCLPSQRQRDKVSLFLAFLTLKTSGTTARHLGRPEPYQRYWQHLVCPVCVNLTL